MPDGVSGRRLAQLLGVDEKAVRKACAAGRIAKLADGTYDVEACRRAWHQSTDPARNKVQLTAALPRTASAPTSAVRTQADAAAAVALIRRILDEQGVDSSDIGYNEARTADTILKAAERDLKIAQRRKELVPLARVADHVNKAFTGYRQAMQRLPSRHAAAIAAELGCDPGALDVLLTKALAAELDALSQPVVRA